MNLESRILNLTDACSTFDADGKRSSIRGQALQMQVGLSLVDSTFCCTTELTVFQYVVVAAAATNNGGAVTSLQQIHLRSRCRRGCRNGIGLICRLGNQKQRRF